MRRIHSCQVVRNFHAPAGARRGGIRAQSGVPTNLRRYERIAVYTYISMRIGVCSPL